MKKFGLFIGIDKYRKFDSKDHLHCAGSDAIALAQAFQDRLGFTTKVLLDTDLGYAEQGSPETIFDQLDDWASQLKQSDETILVLYFAGHGVMLAGEQYLLAPKAPQHAMTRPSSGLPGVISESALLDHTQHWPNVKRVLVFDACRTALDVRVETTVSARIAYGARKQEPDLAILRACPPDQVALELHHYPVDGQTRSHGLYTAAFLSVLEQRASNERHFILDDGFNRDIANTMQALVQQHAPEGEQIRMQAQQPLRDGAPLCLADVADFNAIKIARLLRTFEDHFAAERYDTPVAQCCADTLRDLVVAKYPPQQVLILSDRLEAARRQQQHQARQVRGESLLRSARMLGTPEAYLRVLEEGFGEYQTEVNEFVAAWQQEKDDAAWREVQADANLVALQKYSRLFPSGRHVAQAQAAIAKLEAAEQEQRENQAWAAVDRASIAALQAFIQHWPNSAHASLVAEMVATLEEDEAWRAVQAQPGIEMINQYLTAFPMGRHVDAAIQYRAQIQHQIEQQAQAEQEAEAMRLAALEWEQKERAAWEKTLQSEDVEAYRDFIHQFPASRHNDEACARLAVMEENWAWEQAQRQNNQRAYSHYLQQYPNGRFSKDAQALLAQLRIVAEVSQGSGSVPNAVSSSENPTRPTKRPITRPMVAGLGVVALVGLVIVFANRNDETTASGQTTTASNVASANLHTPPTAAADDAETQYQLGWNAAKGIGGPRDYELALASYTQAAAQGHAEAQVQLGRAYLVPELGLARDDEAARAWFAKAAEKNNANGQAGLATFFLFGAEAQRNIAEGRRWLNLALAQDNGWAKFTSGRMYLNGVGVDKNLQLAFDWVRKSAEQGYPEGVRALGWCYWQGTGVAMDKKEALVWYRKAMELGDLLAQTQLGLAYLNGEGIDKDVAQGVALIKAAAGARNIHAEVQLGFLYQNGTGVEKDIAEAVKWYRLAAEAGDETGQSILGRMYLTGLGVNKDEVAAVKWLENAAAQGGAHAKTNLGYAHNLGLGGLPKDEKRALALYLEAAAMDEPTAQKNLGQMYEFGTGVTKNEQTALAWYNKAANNGDEDAKQAIARLEARKK